MSKRYISSSFPSRSLESPTRESQVMENSLAHVFKSRKKKTGSGMWWIRGESRRLKGHLAGLVGVTSVFILSRPASPRSAGAGAGKSSMLLSTES